MWFNLDHARSYAQFIATRMFIMYAFPPFPVFLKLSHTPELSWDILIDNLSVRIPYSMPMAKQARQIWAEKLGLYKIKLYCIVITLYRIHTKENKKKTFPSQSSCNPLDAILLFPMCKKPQPVTKFRAAKPTQQIATREQIELHPSQRDFSTQYHI